METFGNSVALLVVSPVAIVTNVIAIVAIVHYRTFFHGTDVVIMSVLVNFILKAFLLAPLPAILDLVDDWQWSETLCSFYVWAGLCFRVSELLNLLCMSIHWMSLLRIETGKQIYTSTRVVRIVVVICWFLAAVAGSLPLLGARSSNYFVRGVCYFLPFDLDLGYSLFLAILSVFCVTTSLICTADTVLLLKHMKKVAVVKYQAGRFYMPNSESTGVAKTTSNNMHARYNELNFSVDLCKLVVFFIVATAVINHVPFTFLQFYQLVWREAERETVQMTVQWLCLGEALFLPHTLWLLSKRYRHAIAYTWRLYVLRDRSAQEEDPYACTLQSYTRKIRAADGKIVRVTARFHGERTIITSDRRLIENGHVPRQNQSSPSPPPIAGPSRLNPGTSRENGSGARVNGSVLETVTTDLDDGMAVITNTGLVPVQRHKTDDVKRSESYGYNARTTDAVDGSDASERVVSKDDVKKAKNDIHLREYTSSQRGSDAKGNDDANSETTSDVKTPRSSISTSQPTSPTKSSLSTPTNDSLKRTSSRCSRNEWKEQMRRKHLPAIFVNEAFDAEEESRSAPKKRVSDGDPGMHFYLSGDFHPDYLVDQELGGEAPYDEGHANYATVDGVTAFQQDSVDVGDANAYDDNDIEQILDHPSTFDPPAFPEGLETPAADLEVENAFTFDPSVPEEGQAYDPWGEQLVQEERVEEANAVPVYTEPSVVVRTQPRATVRTQQAEAEESLDSDVFSPENSPEHFSGVSAAPEVQASWQDSARMRCEGVSSPTEVVLQPVEEVVPIPMEKDYQLEPSKAASEFTTFKQTDSCESGGNERFSPVDASLVSRDSPRSSSSCQSVTLEPCRSERRPPWLADAEDSSDKMAEPLLGESTDSETLKDSMSYLRLQREQTDARSDASSPLSLFDDEIDRGFEEALAVGYSRGPVYGGMGLCFESIEEEPEEYLGQDRNPFEKDSNALSPEFRTQAIVSRPSSVCSAGSRSPVPEYPMVNGDVNGDLGSASNSQASSKTPWPEEEDQVRVIDLSFESDFSDMRNGSFLDVPPTRADGQKSVSNSDKHVRQQKADLPMTIPTVSVNGIPDEQVPQVVKCSNGKDRTVYF